MGALTQSRHTRARARGSVLAHPALRYWVLSISGYIADMPRQTLSHALGRRVRSFVCPLALAPFPLSRTIRAHAYRRRRVFGERTAFDGASRIGRNRPARLQLLYAGIYEGDKKNGRAREYIR